ncbi:AMP-binding protein, partial [Saccharopolyspora taberi]|uniref:AMP-binding protein n=1 Tax=Saccharopolyspora taberi TaxID=60895 RepID=UPI0031CEC173
MITGGVPERLRDPVNRAAHRLAGYAGERIAIDADTALDRLCWFLGADLAGAAALVVEPTWSARERAAVFADARPAAIVTGSPGGPGGVVGGPVGVVGGPVEGFAPAGDLDARPCPRHTDGKSSARHATAEPTTRHATSEPSARHTTPEPTPRHTTPGPTARHATGEPTPGITGIRPTTGFAAAEPTGRHTIAEPTPRHTDGESTTRHATAKPTAQHATPGPTTRHATGEPTAGHITGEPTTRHITGEPAAGHTDAESSARHATAKPIPRHTTAESTTRHTATEPTPQHTAPDPTADFAPVGNAESRFYLPTTSGTSGRPKVLIRSRRSWLDSFAALDLGLRPDDTVLIPGPLSSSLFLFGALHALHAKADVHLLERWSVPDAVAACRRATVVHLVPAMLSALLPHLDDCPLRTIVCAGARLDPAIRSRLGGRELVEYYGSAEQSLIAVDRGDGLRPVVDVEARGGQLWARSGMVFDGYLDQGAVRFPEDWHDGWSTVGDRGALHDDGTLEVHGRSTAVLNTGASLVSAEDVESVLRGVDGVRDVLVSATPHPRFGDLVTAVVEVDDTAPPSLRALRERARATLAPAQ